MLSGGFTSRKQGPTFGLYLLDVPLSAFASIELLYPHHDLRAKLPETRLAQFLPSAQFRDGIGYCLAFGDVSARFHCRFNEQPIFLSKRDGYRCHAGTVSNSAACSKSGWCSGSRGGLTALLPAVAIKVDTRRAARALTGPLEFPALFSWTRLGSVAIRLIFRYRRADRFRACPSGLSSGIIRAKQGRVMGIIVNSLNFGFRALRQP